MVSRVVQEGNVLHTMFGFSCDNIGHYKEVCEQNDRKKQQYQNNRYRHDRRPQQNSQQRRSNFDQGRMNPQNQQSHNNYTQNNGW